jgi:hypothetical protein
LLEIIFFVYLPPFLFANTTIFFSETSPVYANHYSFSEERNREIVMQTATELDIPIIDIHNEVFKTHPDPLSLFPFRIAGHYNAEV